MKTLNALTVRKKFGSVLDEVWRDKVRIIVSRDNKPLVVMVPYDEYELEQDMGNRKTRLLAVSKRMDVWRQKHIEHFTRFNSVEIIREMRKTQ
jgi:prevent-host-death family protein